MKNIESLFDFYIKNKLYTTKEEKEKKVLASIFAVIDNFKDKSFDLSKVIEMIMLDNLNTDKLINKSEIKAILEEFYSNQTNESQEAKKCQENAKNMKFEEIEGINESVFGRLLLSVGIDIEYGLKLDFNRLYKKVIEIEKDELDYETNERLKYCYYCNHDVTEEYAYLISILEEIVKEKINKSEEFNKSYEEQKKFYRSMPILNVILDKTKKL